MNNGKIQSFTDLKVWKEGHLLVVEVYKITKLFPKAEIYALVSQMQRSAASITANIAEGFSRQSYKEKLQFYYLSLGSLTELKNFILISKDVGYLDKKDFDRLVTLSNNTHQLLQGFIQKTKSIIHNS